MNDVRGRRTSGVVWASLAYMLAVPFAWIVAHQISWWVMYGISCAGVVPLGNSTHFVQYNGWPRPIPAWICYPVAIAIMWLGTSLAVCVGLWVYHRMVYREAFKRLALENVEFD